MPRHDWRKEAAIRPLPGLKRSHDLFPGPAADAGLLVRRNVAADEDTLPGISKPTSDPPRNRELSGFPKKYPGVWQSLQPPIVTRYSPRAVCASSAAAMLDCSPNAEAAKNANRTLKRNIFPSMIQQLATASELNITMNMFYILAILN